MLFFRNSLIITCSLLVEALIVDSLFVCQAQPAERLRSIVNTIRTNQMMNLFLLSQYQLGGVGLVVGGGGGSSSRNVGRRRKDKANDDGTVLVEEQDDDDDDVDEEAMTTVVDEEVKSTPNHNEIWQFLSVAIDRVLIATLLVIYVISIFTLIPLARLDISNPIKVEN